MSAGGDMDVTCSCGHHFSAWLWQSANVTTNPELKTSILNGEMNIVKCPSCGGKFHVELPFLYHDMSGKEWIWVYPLGHETERGSIQAKVGEMWDRLTGSMSPDVKANLEAEYRVSVMFGMDALVGHLRSKPNN
ncbi:MAG: CpXC domain-containing protein [Candidatus Eisenbacteria bacterium]